MKTQVSSFRAKYTAFKVAVIENHTSLKELAANTDTSYSTMLRIGSGAYNTSGIRAKAIAHTLNKDVTDIFDEQ